MPSAKEKPPPRILECHDVCENLRPKMESCTETGAGKPSVSSVRNGAFPPPPLPPCSGNALPADRVADGQRGPWCSSQLPGHRWLIPVMSPFEGLVFKPYPGPEYSESFDGGSLPYGPGSFPGSFPNSVIRGSIPYPGPGAVPGAQPVAHSYFPYLGAPVVTSTMSGIEPMNHAGGSSSFNRSSQFSAAGSYSMRHPIPSDAQNPVPGCAPHLMKFPSSKESELLGSTASSPGDIIQGTVPDITQGKDAFPPAVPLPALFVPPAGPHSRHPERQIRVIKVVPHNRISATESAARIFRSIQEERKQLDSVS